MRLLSAAFSLALVTATQTSSAQERPARASAPSEEAPSSAARLKKRGDDAFLALRYADALRAYDDSYKLTPNPALHYNRGRTLEALERTAEAVDAYERFLSEAPADLRERAAKLGEHVKGLRQKIATLDLRIVPDGARILVRRVAIGTSPLRGPLRLNAGPALIEIEAEGREPERRELVLEGGTARALTVELKPKGATLALVSDPHGASFFVDGAPIEGNTAQVAPGRHVVRAALGDNQVEQAVSLKPGERADVTLHLHGRTIFSRWWFWTAAGVVVAGAAAVTVVVLTQPGEPRTGDIQPGRLTAPLLAF